ncbi:MAG: AzlC family ABC transporter permease [Syntrophomonadaceae bacterium]|nr:AzlC family ABC transporter permease [Syntrophomonadaceae bacterium]
MPSKNQIKPNISPIHRVGFIEGCKAAVPIAIGYIPIGITFGLLAQAAGIPNYITVMMSLVIFAGASQFVGINLIALGTGYIEIILTTFILNLRHLLMSASLSQKLASGTPKGILALLAFGVTDETFSVASFRSEAALSPEFLAGLNLLAYSAWNLGTWLGFFLAAGLPEAIKNSMGIALYVMFIGLLVPSCRKSRATLTIALLAMAVHYLLQYVPATAGLSTGLKIVITTLAAALVGAVIFSEEDNG